MSDTTKPVGAVIPMAVPEVVSLLERVLEDAKVGKVRWIGISTIGADQSAAADFAGYCPTPMAMGALEHLKMAIWHTAADFDGEST